MGAWPALSWTMSGAGVYSMCSWVRMSAAMASTPSACSSVNTAGGMKPRTAHRGPAQLGQLLVHLVQAGDALRADARGLQALQVDGVRLVGQVAAQLAQDVAPHRLIAGRVGVVVLAHHVAPQVGGQAGDGPFRGGHGRLLLQNSAPKVSSERAAEIR